MDGLEKAIGRRLAEGRQRRQRRQRSAVILPVIEMGRSERHFAVTRPLAVLVGMQVLMRLCLSRGIVSRCCSQQRGVHYMAGLGRDQVWIDWVRVEMGLNHVGNKGFGLFGGRRGQGGNYCIERL